MYNGINITQVGNGFIVSLPEFIVPQPMFDEKYYQTLEKMAGKMRGKDVLEEIKEKQEQQDKEKTKFADAILSNVKQIPVSENVFVFHTFDEVIIFLKDKFN